MIHRTIPTWQAKNWQEELSALITEPEVLFEKLKLDPIHLPMARKACALFPLRVTDSYLNRIAPGKIDDPLLKQILPLGEELEKAEGYSDDPLGEKQSNPAPGLIHKYHGRVLLIAASQCAINCRYCFRRHFDYQNNTPSRKDWGAALDYIRQDDSIDEVILSGGDPLAVSDKQLSWLVSEIESIRHITRLRIHSRLPIVLPSRITGKFVETLEQTRLQSVMVVHSNHPQEIDLEVAQAFHKLKVAGITLLNQSVLLKSINNEPQTLITLSKLLFSKGVLPYYLHLLDKVLGAKHFDVEPSEAKTIHKIMMQELPGYLVPKLVKEIPSTLFKTPVT